MGKKDGFYLYFDWEQPFDRLNDADLGKIVRAMMKYVKHGEEPPKDFEGGAAFVADFVFPQIKRSIQYAENGAKGGNKTAKNQEPKPSVEPLVEPTVEPTVEALNININQNINQDINNTPTPPKGADVYGERFEKFWAAYPKKQGKGAAEKAFRKIKPSGDLLLRMISAIEEQRKSDQWTRDRGQYIPNPSTWLNQERWNDETASPQAPIKQDISYEEFFRGMRSRKG